MSPKTPMAIAATKAPGRRQRSSAKHASRPTRRWQRWLLGVSLAAPLVLAAFWYAVHRFPWAGPLVANTLRAIVGVEGVARLEDFVYGIEDRYNHLARGDEQPRAYWEVPQASEVPPGAAEPSPAEPSAEQETPAVPALPPFRPKAVGPVHASWSAPGDGEWVPLVDRRFTPDSPYLYKTLLHPDKSRSWAELFVVAIDLRRVAVHPVLGTREPKPNVDPEPTLARPGRIPEANHARAIAAFNGGFMTEHGHYGMMLAGVTIVSPRKNSCTLAHYRDGSFEIATWDRIAGKAPSMLWYRQTPNCMYEDGKMNRLLAGGYEKRWGATLDGKTVIRRSAIGLDASQQTLLVGITNHTTATALATGMHHAGAVTVAQLDVNWSYPKFVVFHSPEPGAPLQAEALAEGFEFREGEYLRDRSLRDFFYLTIPENSDAPTPGD